MSLINRISLYQSFYKPEQRQLISPECIAWDNTKNPTPDLREYPQMQEIHKIETDNIKAGGRAPWGDVYGLISWKFQEKTLIPPEKFIKFINVNAKADFWFVNPCQCLETLFENPWLQGEIWHPGITQLAEDTFKKMEPEWSKRIYLRRVYPRNKMFFANYFAARSHVWEDLLSFTEEFYKTIKNDEDLNKRMMAASGYATDPGMSHFIFLFERLVPTFLMHRGYDCRGYEYSYPEVSGKFTQDEWTRIRSISEVKKTYAEHTYNNNLENAYMIMKSDFQQLYPNSWRKE